MEGQVAPQAAPLRYFGGKFRQAPAIVGMFPQHRTYVEPFGGSAAVMLRKPRSKIEVYNDLDNRIVNLFRVLRHPVEGRLLHLSLEATPYAEEEMRLAMEPMPEGWEEVLEQRVEDARRMIAMSRMNIRRSIKGAPAFKFDRVRSRAKEWLTALEHLPSIARRFQGVVIHRRDALEVMAKYDDEDTLFYCDPPYVAETRVVKSAYAYEMDDDGHRKLSEALHGLRGMVLLSGYHSELYDSLYGDWEVCELPAATLNGGGGRAEVVWANRAGAVNMQPMLL